MQTTEATRRSWPTRSSSGSPDRNRPTPSPSRSTSSCRPTRCSGARRRRRFRDTGRFRRLLHVSSSPRASTPIVRSRQRSDACTRGRPTARWSRWTQSRAAFPRHWRSSSPGATGDAGLPTATATSNTSTTSSLTAVVGQPPRRTARGCAVSTIWSRNYPAGSTVGAPSSATSP
ncbi:Uncharacterised protein [Mycobacteroides abscessus subsp. abscessus]|nr:Uncharacterised protein [Mycobacteroides abscessus subsp. abscessus]